MEEVTISKEEYEELKLDSRKYHALVGSGVDNWDGYDLAMQDFPDE